MRHLIKKQVVELNLSTEKDMFSVQQKATLFFYQKILPALEKVLDGLTDDDHIIQIDKLEIDLDGIEWESGKQELQADELYNKIEKETVKAVLLLKDKLFVNGSKGLAVENAAQPIAGYSFDQWTYYLKNGFLPWSLSEMNDNWRNKVLEALATDYHLVAECRMLLDKNEKALQRLVNSHSTDFLVRLTAILTAADQSALVNNILELEIAESPNANIKRQSGDKPPVGNTATIWKEVIKLAGSGLTGIDIMEKVSTKLKETNLGEKKPFNDLHDQNTDLRNLINTGSNNQTAGELILPGEGLFAPNAGLVLLHPFFKYLFARAGLTKENKFIDQHAQGRAIYLLHFIATGDTTCEEHLLAVPKILCGYPLEFSPLLETELSEMEKIEGMDMLSAAIEQWTILKNTTADGLREGFLQRRGKMYTNNDNLCFAVEPHAIDVLLDHLPWNLSIVKLPWINDLIKVEWR